MIFRNAIFGALYTPIGLEMDYPSLPPMFSFYLILNHTVCSLERGERLPFNYGILPPPPMQDKSYFYAFSTHHLRTCRCSSPTAFAPQGTDLLGLTHMHGKPHSGNTINDIHDHHKPSNGWSKVVVSWILGSPQSS